MAHGSRALGEGDWPGFSVTFSTLCFKPDYPGLSLNPFSKMLLCEN